MDDIYRALKSLIQYKGYTQKEVAEKIGMPEQTFRVKINRISGRDFQLNEALEISKVLDEPVDSFFLPPMCSKRNKENNGRQKAER